MKLPDKLTKTIYFLSRLPGVGEKTANRLGLFLTKWSAEELNNFANAIHDLQKLRKCKECNFFAELEVCEICSDFTRKESRVLCVVESISDCMAIERSGHYQGLYHVLGGVLNPLLGIGPQDLALDVLVQRVLKHGITELILAINPSVEGDATCSYIRSLFDQEIRIERIGLGMPMGGSLEHLDPQTISKAIEYRRSL